jgi:GNAT superfamily N-acetyltransferase
MTSNGKVRPATAVDMAIIEAWLPKDRSVGTLAANWNLTMEKFGEGRVSVWEDDISHAPVAYCWGSLNSHDSILEVKPDCRGRGVGRALAEFMLERSIASGEPLLEIQIAPESSEPFWQAMGFETYWERDSCYGRRTLKLCRSVPAGNRRPVVVTFLPKEAAWTPDVEALAVYQLDGVEVPAEGKIVLDTPVAHFDLPDGDDLVVEVAVCGVRLYRDKAKYKTGTAVGIQRCKNGFIINEVLTGDRL